jgi:hypothetical protein
MGDTPLPLASRTVEGIQHLAAVLRQVPESFTLYRTALTSAANGVFKDLASHPVRGTMLPSSQDLSFQHVTRAKPPPIWFVFSGMVLLAITLGLNDTTISAIAKT